MNADNARSLFAYNDWANRRVLAAVTRLAPDEFTRELGASFGSVRGTLVHLMWGEKRWLEYWIDGSLIPDPPPDAFSDFSSLTTAWSELESRRQPFVEHLTNERLSAKMILRDVEYTLGELIQHLLNHSTYHRGQIALLLRQLGHDPSPTDYRLFLVETRAPAA